MLDPVTQFASLEASGARTRRADTQAATQELPDLLLIERARSGEEQAIEALIRRYSRRVFRVARSLLDEDAAEAVGQERELAAFGRPKRYVARRVRAAPGFLELTPERLDRIVTRVLTLLPQGSMLTISASPP